jgi:hypothetical protein
MADERVNRSAHISPWPEWEIEAQEFGAGKGPLRHVLEGPEQLLRVALDGRQADGKLLRQLGNLGE